ncbi:MAG: hypothetical protein A2571_01870 [Candidatus Vogelbacteria bacterium RIFOXYD1_FULL_44_32]|uniref:SHSP domain-containing protein n=1 Tax=Candidatus Vogelbacteria bacterium RIFOXYD1_FULL_44_32 TaxID=1802438 RepID=A0A1G2QDJ3_9BACT|nr:MAG: hypothetical protein A2571_01870 [Candidatus Vogelbacteria bacterium RIFOXYD1_FULL_44_32]
MAKDRRSFFERITGTISVADDHDDFAEIIPEPTRTQADWTEEEVGELAVDVYQTPSEIIIQTMAAGVKAEDLNINITREMVTIKGTREAVRTIADEDYFQRELYWGSFARTILLPAEVETEEAEATERNGLLTIRLPKIDKDKSTKLKVKTGQ